MKQTISFLALALGLAMWGSAAQALVVYSNDFDNPVVTAPGVTASGPSGGFIGSAFTGPYSGSNGKSWSGNHFASGGASTLTLTGLGPHTTVSIDMMLGFLNSWDSRDGGCCAPDNLEVWVDGVQLLNMTSNNALGTIQDFDGGTFVAMANIDNTFHGNWQDVLVDMATAPNLSFAHSGSTLSLSIMATGAGWQGLNDEGWAIDSLSITTNQVSGPGGTVPEPAALVLMGLGLAGIGFARKRTRA